VTDSPASPRLAALQDALAAGDRAALERFWAEVDERGTPLVDPAPGGPDESDPPEPLAVPGAAPYGHVLVTFLWRGGAATENVVVVGPFGHREPADGRMARLPGTDVWYRTYRLRADARTVYRLAENDSLAPLPAFGRDPQRFRERTAGWRPDPRNRDPFPAAQPWASALVLPAAAPQPWVAPRPGVPPGTLEHARLASAILGNERDVTVYTPPGYDPAGAPYPLVILFDRGAYLAEVPTPTILDNLLAAARLPAPVAVLVGNPDQATRNRELPCHAPFVRFLTEELLPWVRGRYRVTDDPARTVVGGSSFGGLAVAFAALERPDVFGNVLSQSGSYFWKPEADAEWEWLPRRYAERERLPVRFYLDVGLLEDDYAGPARPPGHPGQLGANRHLRTLLRAKGYPVHYAEFCGGHDYLCWRGTLADGLLALLGRPNGGAEAAARTPD
jgi:enterochelin esterase-like enzyme